MKIQDLLKELDELNLPANQYAIVSSGVMAIYGIRDANDLDVVTTDQLWDKLAKTYKVTPPPRCERIKVGNVEFLGEGSMWQNPKIATPDELINSADIIDGHRYIKLEYVKAIKATRADPKDLTDIELIDKYLTSRNALDG